MDGSTKIKHRQKQIDELARLFNHDGKLGSEIDGVVFTRIGKFATFVRQGTIDLNCDDRTWFSFLNNARAIANVVTKDEHPDPFIIPHEEDEGVGHCE